MLVLELFAGTRSIGKAFERKGHKVVSVDWDKELPNMDFYGDIEQLSVSKIKRLCGGQLPQVIWASPDCTTYSIAAISHHRIMDIDGNLSPKSDYAFKSDCVVKHVLDLISEIKPMFYFIENPRGGLRKMNFMKGLYRYTLTYCQYGDKRMKPTDIWTNYPSPNFKPCCHRGDSCHEAAPRGAKTGTQGLEKRDRSRIPDQLCDYIVTLCERYLKERNIKLCPLYYPPFNFKRTGCKGCPFSLELQNQLSVMDLYLPKERQQCEFIWKPIYDEYRRIGYRLNKYEQIKLF